MNQGAYEPTYAFSKLDVQKTEHGYERQACIVTPWSRKSSLDYAYNFSRVEP